MLRRAILLMPAALFAFAAEERSIEVHGPTVVAFFAPIKHPETEQDELRALDQFKANAKRVRERLEHAGIEFDEVYQVSFKVRVGGKTDDFDSGHMKVGYYFIAPGKEPRVEYGVASPMQIAVVAHDYFGIAIPD